MTIDQSILDEIVRRIVDVAHPDRIILFGSAARGEMGPDSDLDLLVVKAGVPHRRETTCKPSSARLFRKDRNVRTDLLRRGGGDGGLGAERNEMTNSGRLAIMRQRALRLKKENRP